VTAATPRQRLAGAFVLLVLALGSLAFWVAAPLGVLWALAKVTDDAVTHFVAGLVLAPVAMLALSPILFWLNNLYLRVTGVLDRLDEDEGEGGWRRRVGGPLEPMLVFALVVALVALVAWFLVAAENPSMQVI
jgi:hypothetical protein